MKKARFELTGDPRDQPQRSLAERVEAGHLGRKTGQGWYRYDEHGTKEQTGTEDERDSTAGHDNGAKHDNTAEEI